MTRAGLGAEGGAASPLPCLFHNTCDPGRRYCEMNHRSRELLFRPARNSRRFSQQCEAFTMRSSVFFAKNPGFTTKIPSRSDLEWDFRRLLYTPFESACTVTAGIKKATYFKASLALYSIECDNLWRSLRQILSRQLPEAHNRERAV